MAAARSGDAAAFKGLTPVQKKAVVGTVVRAQDGPAADALGIDRAEFSNADYARINLNLDGNSNTGKPPLPFTDVPDHELDDTQKADLEAINRPVRPDGPSESNSPAVVAIGVRLQLAGARDPGGQAAARVADALKVLFQKRIVFVGAALGKIPWAGASPVTRRNALLINAEQQAPLLYLSGHELGHAMETQAPEVYARLKTALLSLSSDFTEFRGELLRSGYTRDRVESQFVHDFIGNQWHEPEFWRLLDAKKPGLFREFARAALDWLKALLHSRK